MSIVSQREVGLDTDSYSDAMKYMMRQNPDIILVGEMRDVESFNVALQASETGHLVFSTLHTSSAAETLDRVINMYPPQDRDMVCLRLSGSLRGVVSQKLLPRADNTGRVAGIEIMIATPTIAKLIEEGRASQLYGAIAEGNFWGMQTMNQCLLKFFRAGLISEDEALANAGNVTEMKQMVRRP
jgi:twitching motility protein PilT